MTIDTRKLRYILVALLAVIVAAGAYAFTASNTVPGTNAGSGSGTISGYSVSNVAYTLDPTTRAFFNSNYLWLTAPFTCFGIWRFLQLVSGRAGRGLRAESPTQEMLRDVPLVLNLVAWVIVVVAIVYQLRPNAH